MALKQNPMTSCTALVYPLSRYFAEDILVKQQYLSQLPRRICFCQAAMSDNNLE